MWHAYWTAGSKLTNQNGVDVQVISNMAIGFPLYWNYKVSRVRVGLGLGLGVGLGAN